MSLYKFKSIDASGEMNVSFKIRKKVFCEEQCISEKIEFDNLDHLCEHFLIYKKDEAIATARVRKKSDQLFNRKLKAGSLLINQIINHYIKTNKKSSIMLHSQVEVEEFYKSLNFTPYGDRFLEDGILHIAMRYLN